MPGGTGFLSMSEGKWARRWRAMTSRLDQMIVVTPTPTRPVRTTLMPYADSYHSNNGSRRQPEGRKRTAGPCQRSHHLGHLLPRPPEHARRGGGTIRSGDGHRGGRPVNLWQLSKKISPLGCSQRTFSCLELATRIGLEPTISALTGRVAMSRPVPLATF